MNVFYKKLPKNYEPYDSYSLEGFGYDFYNCIETEIQEVKSLYIIYDYYNYDDMITVNITLDCSNSSFDEVYSSFLKNWLSCQRLSTSDYKLIKEYDSLYLFKFITCSKADEDGSVYYVKGSIFFKII